MPVYKIETYDTREHWWTTDGLEAASGANVFATPDVAYDAIQSLRELGGDWADAQYRVAEYWPVELR